MQKISATKIIDRIFRDFRPADSNWVGDAWDMIGEAIEGIGYHVGFEIITDSLTVSSNRVKWKKKYNKISHIVYNNKRLPLGGDFTTLNIASSSTDNVEVDPYRLARLKELNTQWQALEDAKATSPPEQIIEIQAKQDELLVEITKLAGELLVVNPQETILGEYYQIHDDYIYTSFQSGTITAHGTAFPVDENNIPYIVDTYKYINACFFKVASLLLMQGYKHPTLNYEIADAKWEYFRAQASNEPRIMGMDKQDRFAKFWTRFKFDPYEASTYFKYVEQK